jgi:hypothetical protein
MQRPGITGVSGSTMIIVTHKDGETISAAGLQEYRNVR